MPDGSRIPVYAGHHESLASGERDRTLWSSCDCELGGAMVLTPDCLWVNGVGLISVRSPCGCSNDSVECGLQVMERRRLSEWQSADNFIELLGV